MAASSSLYRKYRSQSFDELVGQEPVVRTLKNAIATGRISHAYLFTGPRGVGKTSAARLLARAANCTSTEDNKPCNKCPNCLAATRDIATDLIEIDAASNTGVDNIRDVIERANFAPSVWTTKFYIIDEIHMLSTSAFNALLKTLEEPPAHTSFVLATTEVHKVPATIVSRCQRFDFRRISLKAMVARLQYVCEQESIVAEPAALELVARQSTGSLRDALSLLDQLRVFVDKGITLESVQDMLGAGGSEEVAAFADALIAGDVAEGLRRINALSEEGRDLRQFNRQIVEHLRNLMLVKSGAAASEGSMVDVTDDMKGRLRKQAEGVSLPDLLRWIKVFGDADASLRSTVYGQLPLEMAFVSSTLKPQEASPRQDVRDHSAELSSGIEQVGAIPRQRPTSQSAPSRVSQSSPPPPPIHMDLGMMSHNGQHASEDIPAAKPTTSLEGARPAEPREPVDKEPLASESEVYASTTPDVSDDLERLISLWTHLVDQINARSKNIASVFRNPDLTRPVSVGGGVCVISFRDPIHVSLSMTTNPPRRDIIEDALRRVLGYECRIEAITFQQAESGVASTQETPPGKQSGRNAAKEKPSPYETTRGKAAMNIFDIDKFDET